MENLFDTHKIGSCEPVLLVEATDLLASRKYVDWAGLLGLKALSEELHDSAVVSWVRILGDHREVDPECTRE
jgi:hypothetical protein